MAAAASAPLLAASTAATESTTNIDDQDDQEDEAQRTAANDRPAQIKTATAEEQQQHEDKEYKVHARWSVRPGIKFRPRQVGLRLPALELPGFRRDTATREVPYPASDSGLGSNGPLIVCSYTPLRSVTTNRSTAAASKGIIPR